MGASVVRVWAANLYRIMPLMWCILLSLLYMSIVTQSQAGMIRHVYRAEPR